MKLGIIIGSHRKQSNSAKVAKYLINALPRLVPHSNHWSIDLGQHPLPLWDEGVWAGEERWTKIWGPISRELVTCDGFIVIAPEYSGMVPAALKNFFLFCGQEMSHKPALIVGVSSSRGGAYPVAELRSSSYKNTRICWIPDHMIVRDADQVLNDTNTASESDTFTRHRLEYSVKILAEYTKALTSVRSSGVIDHKAYPFGM